MEKIEKLVEGTKVNWDLYLELRSDGFDMNEIHRFLLQKNILSMERKDNFDVVASGYIGLNPWLCGAYLYFCQKENVINFVKKVYNNTVYEVFLKRNLETIKF